MANTLYGSLGLKQDGGIPIAPYQEPIIFAGQYCKLAAVITDRSDRALTLTSYSLKLRLKKTDDTILVLEGVPVDNNKGEMEFELVPDDSKLLKIGSKLDAELEIYLTGSPQVTSFITLKEAISVVNQTLPPP